MRRELQVLIGRLECLRDLGRAQLETISFLCKPEQGDPSGSLPRRALPRGWGREGLLTRTWLCDFTFTGNGSRLCFHLACLWGDVGWVEDKEILWISWYSCSDNVRRGTGSQPWHWGIYLWLKRGEATLNENNTSARLSLWVKELVQTPGLQGFWGREARLGKGQCMTSGSSKRPGADGRERSRSEGGGRQRGGPGQPGCKDLLSFPFRGPGVRGLESWVR